MTTKTRRTAVLYLRQSKAKDDSISLEIQEAEGRAHCARRKLKVVGVVKDEGVSGYRDWRKRPNFSEVFNVAADTVVVYRWSRLSRRRLDQAVLIDLLEKAGKLVESACEPVDPSTAGGRFSRDQMLLMASFESDVKGEQWKEAQARRIKAGLPAHGKARFGYRKTKEGNYKPDPVTGKVLADCYRRYVDDAGFVTIVKALNDDGVRTMNGNTWTTQSLTKVLDSGFGAGVLNVGVHSEEGVRYLPGAHEGVIDAELWQAYLDARAKRTRLAPKRRSPRWHLYGIAVCGLCGDRLILKSYEGPNATLCCSRYHARRTCEGVWMQRGSFEGRVAIWLGGHVDELAALASTRDAERARQQAEVARYQKAFDAAVKALGSLAASHARGLIDDDGLEGAQAELVTERDAAVTALTQAREELDRLGLPGDVYDAAFPSEETSPGERAKRLGQVLRRVELHPDKIRFVPVIGEAEDDPREVRRKKAAA